jgi:hypothetical protein
MGETDIFSLRARCSALVFILSTDLDWKLSKAQQDAYVDALVQLIPANRSWLQMRDLVIYYHQDHPLVESLARLEQQPDQARWNHWIDETIDRLQDERFGHDPRITSRRVELATISLQVLNQALPTYRYTRPFLAWATDVVAAALHDHLSRAPETKQQEPLRSREV